MHSFPFDRISIGFHTAHKLTATNELPDYYTGFELVCIICVESIMKVQKCARTHFSDQ